MDLDSFINDICERYNFRYPRTAQYYLLYNGILFNTPNIRDTAKMLINKLLAEIANIQELSKSPIDTKKIPRSCATSLPHDSDMHIRLRQSLNNWAFIETSARVAVIRALSKTLNSCIYKRSKERSDERSEEGALATDEDWRFIRSYIDNLVMCLHDHERKQVSIANERMIRYES
jgi:hypothetical protein